MPVKSKIIISIICIFIGFTIALQFNTASEANQRETKDMWEVRAQIQDEQKQQQQLYQQISDLEQTLQEYQQKSEQEQISSLKKSIKQLKIQAGLAERTSKGIELTIEPVFVDSPTGSEYPMISPELLNQLVNELNTYGAKDIAIEKERIVSTSPIRYVNGETYVNNHALPDLPITISILTDSPQRLIDYMEVSDFRDNIAIENMSLTMSKKAEMTLPAYQGNIDFDSVKVNEETGED